MLGQEDGISFVGKVKETSAAWRTIPIFVVSNTASAEKVQTYMRLGVQEYYVKAEHPLEEIIADIRRTVEHPEA